MHVTNSLPTDNLQKAREEEKICCRGLLLFLLSLRTLWTGQFYGDAAEIAFNLSPL